MATSPRPTSASSGAAFPRDLGVVGVAGRDDAHQVTPTGGEGGAVLDPDDRGGVRPGDQIRQAAAIQQRGQDGLGDAQSDEEAGGGTRVGRSDQTGDLGADRGHRGAVYEAAPRARSRGRWMSGPSPLPESAFSVNTRENDRY
jgi:hypothetical protein